MLFPLVYLLIALTALPAAGQIRLVGAGSSRCSGRVEVYYNSQWGTVCDDNWDLSDAQVVCRQMDCGTVIEALKRFGEGTGPIWLDDVVCSGSESSLTRCGHGGFGNHNCGHSEDAGVICSGSFSKPTITVSKQKVTWGQSVRVTCTIKTEHSGGTFTLKHQTRDVQTSSSNPATFTLSSVTFGNKGPYYCVYQKVLVGRSFSSPQSDSVSFDIEVILPKPSVSVSPSLEVTWGQSVRVTCSIKTEHSGGTFTLKHQTQDVQTSTLNPATFTLSPVTFDNEGPYHCVYQKVISGRSFSSPQSDLVTLDVSVILPKPSVSVSPSLEVTWGQSVRVTCSITTEHSGGTFTLKDQTRDVQTSTSNPATFTLSPVTFDNEGPYHCVYQKVISGRSFSSPQSDLVTLDVAVILPKPSVSVSPSLEVTWGQSVRVTCSIKTEHSGGTFTLKHQTRDVQTSTSNPATFTLSPVTFDNEGPYHCVYQKVISGRSFSSPQSDSVSLDISVNLPKPSVSVSPSLEVTWGQSVRVTCSITTEHSGGTFTLKDQTRDVQTSTSNPATFTLSPVTFDNEGPYHCVYQKVISGRSFSSPQSDLVTLDVSVILPKPSVSVSPSLEVTWGQSVRVTCSIKTEHSGGTFTLKHQTRDVQTSTSNPATFTLSPVTFDNEGPYHCVYQKVISGRSFSSPQSDSVSLDISVNLPKPSVSVSPSLEVTWGQSVRVTCFIKTEHSGGTFTLKHQTQDVQTSTSNPATFTLSPVTFDNEGPYHCVYQKVISGRSFSSPQSDSFRLQVTVVLPEPSLCVSSAAVVQQCSSDTVHITRGQDFVISCSVHSDVPEGIFVLIFSNSSVSEPAVNYSASFHFPESQSEHQGEYRCVYQVTGAGHTFTSETAVYLNIKLPLVLVVVPGPIGVLLLLFLTLAIIYLVHKRKSKAGQSGNTQMTVPAENQCLEDEEEEGTYANVGAQSCAYSKRYEKSNAYMTPDWLQKAETNEVDDDNTDENIYANSTITNCGDEENIYQNH